ncbi:MAG: hypothetical protein ABJA98_02810 [Acidobacteriota bacterium]
MRVKATVIAVSAALSFSVGNASAQSRFDVGLLLGTTRATDEGAVLQFDRGTTYQATFAWTILRTNAASLSVEVPFIASPAFTVVTAGPSLPLEYASLYLTPGIRVTVRPDSSISFFGAVGGGYARYSESKLRADRSPNPNQLDTNAGALQFGGGIDVRGFGWLGFRGELRDVYTGPRNFSISTPGPRVHNVIGSGGLVVRF